jgi:hypothetical protein
MVMTFIMFVFMLVPMRMSMGVPMSVVMMLVLVRMLMSMFMRVCVGVAMPVMLMFVLMSMRVPVLMAVMLMFLFVLIFHVNIKLRPRNMPTLLPRDMQVVTSESKLGQPMLQFVRIHSQINHRPDEHVTADAAKDVQVKRFHRHCHFASPAASALI